MDLVIFAALGNREENVNNKRKKKNKQLIWIALLSFVLLVCVIAQVQKKTRISEQKNSIQSKRSENANNTGNANSKEVMKKNVRVLIKTTGFTDSYHKKVTLTSKSAFTVRIGKKTTQYPANAKVTFTKKDKAALKKKIIIKAGRNAKLCLSSIKRQNRHPSYRGSMELSLQYGKIIVVNELPIEQYLYAVVPSELSTGHQLEALKAQAVCARSYLYGQLKAKRYQKYHANVDDSVSCQVYNNIPEDARSREAVDQTKGQVLTSGGKGIAIYYFSTSWGSTASAKEVWKTASETSYLPAKIQITSEEQTRTGLIQMDLSNETDFRNFLTNKFYDTYDSHADWYRWNVTIAGKSLSVRFDQALAECYRSNPSMVLTKTKKGTYQKKPVVSIGKLKDIQIAKREKSGLVTELLLIGKDRTVKVISQYNIRKVLAPLYEKIYYKNATASTMMKLLPSAAFYIEKASVDNKAAYRFVGGGFGHGCGMSQEGAARMAELGKNYVEILQQYFEGAQLTQYQES